MWFVVDRIAIIHWWAQPTLWVSQNQDFCSQISILFKQGIIFMQKQGDIRNQLIKLHLTIYNKMRFSWKNVFDLYARKALKNKSYYIFRMVQKFLIWLISNFYWLFVYTSPSISHRAISRWWAQSVLGIFQKSRFLPLNPYFPITIELGRKMKVMFGISAQYCVGWCVTQNIV